MRAVGSLQLLIAVGSEFARPGLLHTGAHVLRGGRLLSRTPGLDLLTRAELEECDELTDLLSDLSLDREYYRWFMDTFFNQVSLASDSSANEIY